MADFRYLSHEQIVSANPSLTDVHGLVVEGFRLHGLGEYENPPKQGIHPRPGTFVHAMPAYLPTRDLAGTKLVSVFPDNPSRGLDTTTGLVVMVDPDTGITTAIVDARWITNVRTALVSIVTSRLLATPEPLFGIIGATGACGRAHLDALAALSPGSRVLVNSRDRARCERLVGDYAGRDLRLDVEMDYEAVVAQADVLIVTTTYLAQPILSPSWLHAGQLVLNVQPRAWPSDVTQHVDLMVCDDREQIMDSRRGIIDLYPDLRIDVEVGQVVAGHHPGRQHPDEIIFAINHGLAIFDILTADYLLRTI